LAEEGKTTLGVFRPLAQNEFLDLAGRGFGRRAEHHLRGALKLAMSAVKVSRRSVNGFTRRSLNFWVRKSSFHVRSHSTA
jgi:hypothetical protein